MPNEKEIEVVAELVYHQKDGVTATDFTKLPQYVKRAYRVNAIELLEKVRAEESLERVKKHIDDNIDVYTRLADR